MGKRQYARCPKRHGVLITLNGKCVLGGQCAAMLVVNKAGEFLPNSISDHKCDTDYSARLAAEWENMSEEDRCGIGVIEGCPDIRDDKILKFANAIQKTIAEEAKIGQTMANGGRSHRAEGGKCPKAALLHIAGMAGIPVADKQQLIAKCTQDLLQGMSSTFFGMAEVDFKEAAVEMFGHFNDWVSHMQGKVDSQGQILCIQQQQISNLMADLKGFAKEGARRFAAQDQINKQAAHELAELRVELAEQRAGLEALRGELLALQLGKAAI